MTKGVKILSWTLDQDFDRRTDERTCRLRMEMALSPEMADAFMDWAYAQWGAGPWGDRKKKKPKELPAMPPLLPPMKDSKNG